MNVLSILAESFADSSFARLFTEMNAATIILFVLGIIFCAVEMCIPGFGVFGITGTLMIIAGIVVRIVCGGDLMMLLYMIVIALVLFVLMFFVFSKLITKSRLRKTPIFSVDPTVSEDKTEGTKDFSYLLGKTGVTQTPLRPVGKATFENESVDVVARDGYIVQDAEITCVQVEGSRVVVVEKK
ncbi:MAG: hypothetical protein NC132_04185 [Corallococcus sp.]|nr:hypothetical protein [Corallococcus sp.]MCM1359858.1 hypothetical protein [Corallococcus sp.]MCM1395292.1 hypothetical protein [Corallococcus sp.]